MWQRTFTKFGEWLKKDEAEPPPDDFDDERRPVRTVVPSLPRPITFARQNSEKRDRLEPNEPDLEERRATSADRRLRSYGGTTLQGASSGPSSLPNYVAPEFSSLSFTKTNLSFADKQIQDAQTGDTLHAGALFGLPAAYDSDIEDPETVSDALEDLQIQDELESKWILNLSMHFRDKSDREKFFITFVDQPNKWRRVTISCDYRGCQPDSLEADLKTLYYQRDKSGKIYEAIRDSLPDIQFLPTVTNLKLNTDDGRLHVHVTEDVNEIIPYPSISLLPYVECPKYKESEVCFESHLSGFVYKVNIRGKSFIKKEIPGPEAVDEFLYEINALSSLRHSKHIIPFEGLIVDEKQENVTGLLINYAENGALVDLLYDLRGTGSLPWSRRERWARQIVKGLSDIHETGFVQGDFTLSNIVIDTNDDARIIDINRRGCPVGWEPPEMSKMIEAGQRISMYIGVKTDLFQLGMVLWALVEEQDEPERVERPLEPTPKWEKENIPAYYWRAFQLCYSTNPTDRVEAKEILAMFLNSGLDGHRKAEDATSSSANQDGAELFGRSETRRSSGSAVSQLSTALKEQASRPANATTVAFTDACTDAVSAADPHTNAQDFEQPSSYGDPAFHVPPHIDSGFDEVIRFEESHRGGASSDEDDDSEEEDSPRSKR